MCPAPETFQKFKSVVGLAAELGLISPNYYLVNSWNEDIDWKTQF